ncbi:MAG: hypothetical protein KDA28_05870, partial [Phycisphaerales bacterium]|nr:hypothetical protein [Phycisphaerales bacterium]
MRWTSIRRTTLICTMAVAGSRALAGPEDPVVLTADQAIEDVRLLREAIEEIHPGYGRYVSPEAMDRLFDDLERRAGMGMSDEDLYLETSLILATLRCDHTKAELPERIDARRRTIAS